MTKSELRKLVKNRISLLTDLEKETASQKCSLDLIQKKEFLRQLEEKSDSKCEDCPFSFYCWGMDER